MKPSLLLLLHKAMLFRNPDQKEETLNLCFCIIINI